MRFVLLLTGWALFGASLALPALTLHGGLILSGTYKGWACVVLGVPCLARLGESGAKGTYVCLVWLTNALMLASPALAVWGGRWRAAQTLVFLTAFALAGSFRLAGGGDGTDYHAGYYVWCASFAVVAAAPYFE